jgi:hypothetical protein
MMFYCVLTFKCYLFSAKEGPNFKINDEFNDQSIYGHEACHEFVVDLTFEQVSQLYFSRGKSG